MVIIPANGREFDDWNSTAEYWYSKICPGIQQQDIGKILDEYDIELVDREYTKISEDDVESDPYKLVVANKNCKIKEYAHNITRWLM